MSSAIWVLNKKGLHKKLSIKKISFSSYKQFNARKNAKITIFKANYS